MPWLLRNKNFAVHTVVVRGKMKGVMLVITTRFQAHTTGKC